MHDFVRADSIEYVRAEKGIKHAAMSADEALQRLIDGNRRFVQGETRSFNPAQRSWAVLAESQHPFATVLGCSDSRVPPELIFDVGIGDLFVIRVAGNIFSPAVAGSLQYAGAILQTPLFVVLGHEGCGAVDAALACRYKRQAYRSRIQFLLDHIIPALPKFDPVLSPQQRLAQAVESNARWMLREISKSPEGQIRQAEGIMKAVAAIYEIRTGQVRFLK
jgi:carbonic anhydrase